MFKVLTGQINTFLISIAIAATSLGIYFHTLPAYHAHTINDNVQIVVTKEMDCLARNIYFESKGESFEGKLAIAQVTLNRANSPEYPSNICDVVYQKKKESGKMICQFSWTCEKEHEPKNLYVWEEAQYIARKALTLPNTNVTMHAELEEKNAMFFHATYVHPKKKPNSIIWDQARMIVQIGKHKFYSG